MQYRRGVDVLLGSTQTSPRSLAFAKIVGGDLVVRNSSHREEVIKAGTYGSSYLQELSA